MTHKHDTSAVWELDPRDLADNGFDTTKPWLFESDSQQLQFKTEDEACAAQRAHRTTQGFDALTGERS